MRRLPPCLARFVAVCQFVYNLGPPAEREFCGGLFYFSCNLSALSIVLLVKEDDGMEKKPPCTEEELEALYDRYGDMLFRMCMVLLRNRQDAEDAVQDTFARWLKKRPEFNGPEHEKAWFLRVASNRCKDKRRSAFFRNAVSLDELGEYAATPQQSDVMERLSSLPPRGRSVLFLHYIEGYSVREVAELLGMKEGAVKTALFRAREKLKTDWKEELSE